MVLSLAGDAVIIVIPLSGVGGMFAGEIGFPIALIDFFTREAGGRFAGSGRGLILALAQLRLSTSKEQWM